MLYCPKCQQTYEEGVQRFCLNDGGRLLPALPLAKSVEQPENVFSSIINQKNTTGEIDEFAAAPRYSQLSAAALSGDSFAADPKFDAGFESTANEITAPESEDIFESAPRFASAPTIYPKPPSDFSDKIEDEDAIELELDFEPLNFARFKPETDSILELEPHSENPIVLETENTPPVLSQSNQPPSSANSFDSDTDEVLPDNLEADPAAGSPTIRENPEILIGQTIKNRYYLIAQIGADESTADYLAQDTANADKTVVVRVLTDTDAKDSFANKIFAEDRVSLSRINHPGIVRVIDSGELSDGEMFLVSEYIEGESVKTRLRQKGIFDASQTARIIRQAAHALSEVHQNSILHRDLKPENIVLIVNEVGAEQVKLTDFGAAKGDLNENNLPYKSPEQLEANVVNFAGDGFALAVVAYQMLTNQLPFDAKTSVEMLKQQRTGLTAESNALFENLPSSIYEVIAKALSFDPAARYAEASGFGDALFNAVAGKSNVPVTPKTEKIAPEVPVHQPKVQPNEDKPPAAEAKPKIAGTVKTVSTNVKETKKAAPLPVPVPKAPVRKGFSRPLFVGLGLAMILAAGIIWGSFYFGNRQNKTVAVAPAPIQNVEPVNQTINNPTPPISSAAIAPVPEKIESVVPSRTVLPPPNSVYFQNKKENLSDTSAKSFLGFSLYYPQNWTLQKAKNNFLDVSDTDGKGFPIEQILVSYYDSRGTFDADREEFPKLLRKSNDDLKRALQGNYKLVSQGEIKIQNNRLNAFEVKFESVGTAADGKKVTLWGRRLWIPAERAGAKNGYVITMLATSLSKDIKSVEEVGVKGELATVLETFEPNL